MNPSLCFRRLLRSLYRLPNSRHLTYSPYKEGNTPLFPSQQWRSSGAAATPPPVNKYWALHELVCSNRYQEAMEVWEYEKRHGQVNPALYSVVMAMCERLASGEAAIAVRQDMTKQGWSMDEKCSVHYINALLADSMSDLAFKCVEKSTTLQDNVSFLTQAANSFYKKGCPDLALKVCCLCKHPVPSLLALQMEALGSLNQVHKMEELIQKHYGKLGDAPVEVQVAFSDGLSMTGQYHRAMDILVSIKKLFRDAIGPKSVALILEAAKTAEDFTTAARVHSLFWKHSCALKEINLTRNFLHSSELTRAKERSSYILRAINATIHLQALALKVRASLENGNNLRNGSVKVEPIVDSATREVVRDGVHGDITESEFEDFLDRNFYTSLRNECVLPDCQTYEALLLLMCFGEGAGELADRAIRTCFQAGSPLTSRSFTEWTLHCGQLSPSRATTVLSLIKRHSIARYEIPLDSTDCERLLGVRLVCENSPKSKKQAVDYIRTIKNVMHRQGYLSDIDNWNLLLSAVGRIGDSGPLFTTYNDMLDENVRPDLNTYKRIVSVAAADGSKRNTLTAVFDWWRSFIREYPRVQPDIQLMNTLIDCCQMSEEYERGFFFFGLLKDYGVKPDIDTFERLFKICDITEDHTRLTTLVSIARPLFPNQNHNISTIVSEIELGWKAKENSKLARTILSHMTPGID